MVPGQPLRVYGTLDSGTDVFFGATVASLIRRNATASIDVTVPAGATSGDLTAASALLGTSSPFPYTVGTLTTVAEVEPNDDVDGVNATAAGNNRVLSGTLSSATDADHFTLGCLEGKIMRLTVTGTAPITSVFINGVERTLTAGSADIFPTNNTLIGLTGAAGTYNITITPN
ncbi:MAG: hypothetical protein MH204_09715 [Fimbriimonadaceae bacterium]|nr:hypothetical protein [Fimbriimonadaceae bacterium]